MINILLAFISLIPSKRIVAEWEPAIGSMIRWPLGIPDELVKELSKEEIVYIVSETSFSIISSYLSNIDVNISNIRYVNTPTASHWTRDYGPQFLIGNNIWKIVDQKFEGYPEEYGCPQTNYVYNKTRKGWADWEKDDETNRDFAKYMNWEIQDLPLFWTGGNFMTDGYGMGFSTQLMVNENKIEKEIFQNILLDTLNINSYHIFENPNELGIQHIDCIAKLLDPETVIIKQVSVLSPEYKCIEAFVEKFSLLNTYYARPFRIHRVYCPHIKGAPWEINPVAAYTNSYIMNGKIFVPQYNIIQDIAALHVYEQAMPGYDVIGFYSTNQPWWSEDALHCRVIGIYDPNMIHISHKSIRTEDNVTNSVFISADIIDYGHFNIQSAKVFWKYASNEGFFKTFDLNQSNETYFSAYFPLLSGEETIIYYINVIDTTGKHVNNPIAGYYTFITSKSGDLNNDNIVNILDIIMLTKYILDDIYIGNADMNLDNQLNILDVISIINVILNL